MHRLVLGLAGILAGITTVVCADFAWCAEPVPVGIDLVYPAEICWPLPPSYPRSWEIVIHTPCPPGYYLPRNFHHDRQSRALHRVGHVAGLIHRRPYLRPGWWW
jgi:hypothetical protein